MIRFALIIAAISITCVAAPTLLYIDWMAGDWLMVTLDIAIILMWGDYLYRELKKGR